MWCQWNTLYIPVVVIAGSYVTYVVTIRPTYNKRSVSKQKEQKIKVKNSPKVQTTILRLFGLVNIITSSYVPYVDIKA